MIVYYSDLLKPYAYISPLAVVDDFGNEILLTDFPDAFLPLAGAMRFLPIEHANNLVGEH